MDEERAREYYIKIKTLREHIQKLTHKIQELDEQTVHIRSMITAVHESANISEGQDMLAQLTHGILIEAQSKPVEHVYLNVGAETLVKKTPKQAITLLEEQQKELTELRKNLIQQRTELSQQAESIEQEAGEHVDV